MIERNCWIWCRIQHRSPALTGGASSFPGLLDAFDGLRGVDDGDAAIGVDHEQILVAGDDELGLGGE
jgi:hypothetical protein